MAKGKRPLSTSVLELRGSYRRNPQRRKGEDSKPKRGLGAPPKHLDAKRRAAWNEIKRQMPDGTAFHSDRLIVEVLSDLLVRFRDPEAKFTTADLTQMRLILSQLGLTLADRPRVKVEAEEEYNPFDDL